MKLDCCCFLSTTCNAVIELLSCVRLSSVMSATVFVIAVVVLHTEFEWPPHRDERKLKLPPIEKIPPPGSTGLPFHMTKSKFESRGPELINNKLQHKQYGIQVGCLLFSSNRGLKYMYIILVRVLVLEVLLIIRPISFVKIM